MQDSKNAVSGALLITIQLHKYGSTHQKKKEGFVLQLKIGNGGSVFKNSLAYR